MKPYYKIGDTYYTNDELLNLNVNKLPQDVIKNDILSRIPNYPTLNREFSQFKSQHLDTLTYDNQKIAYERAVILLNRLQSGDIYNRYNSDNIFGIIVKYNIVPDYALWLVDGIDENEVKYAYDMYRHNLFYLSKNNIDLWSYNYYDHPQISLRYSGQYEVVFEIHTEIKSRSEYVKSLKELTFTIQGKDMFTLIYRLIYLGIEFYNADRVVFNY